MDKFLDKLGITEPWVQLAIVGLGKRILVFSVPALAIGYALRKTILIEIN